MTQNAVSAFLILERNIIKYNVSLDVIQFNSAFFILDVRLNVHDLHEPLKASVPVLELLSEINDYSYRFRECVDVQDERDEIRDLNKSVRDQYRASDNDHDVYEKDESGHAGLEQSEIEITVLLRSQESIVALLKFIHFDVFIRKGLNDPDP